MVQTLHAYSNRQNKQECVSKSELKNESLPSCEMFPLWLLCYVTIEKHDIVNIPWNSKLRVRRGKEFTIVVEE